MTREQAIKIIHKELSCVDRDNCKREECKSCDLVMPSKEPIIEAYKMAIEALEKINKFQTTYNRVLSAKKVEDVEDLDGDELMLALAGILGCEPRAKAKWILASKKGTVDPWWCRFKCSNCGITTSKFNYCPNCGAEMQGVEEQ